MIRAWTLRFAVAAVLAGPVTLAAFPQAEASQLIPHQAEYSLRLNKTLPGSGVADARGSIEYRFEQVCDGWISENRTALSIRSPEGDVYHTAYSFVSWESLDGSRYRFHIRNVQGGQLASETSGEAVSGPNASASFTIPEETSMDLPDNVLFPTSHLKELLAAAADGKQIIASPVFDGSTEHPLALINTFINTKRVNEDPSKTGLERGPFTPMRLAFFAQPEQGSEPIFEMSINYAPSGFTNAIIQDFGDFQVRGTLETVERLPDPNCGVPG